jgi:hypothetical protein
MKVRERKAASAVTALRNFVLVLRLEAFALVRSSGCFDIRLGDCQTDSARRQLKPILAL